MEETRSEKVSKFIKSNAINFALILLCVIYIARGIATIDKKEGVTIGGIIADGCLAFFVGVTIKTILRKKGLMNGQLTPSFVATCNTYGESVNEIAPNIQYADYFCEDENNYRLMVKQKRYLIKYSVNFDEYISGKYDIIPNRKDFTSKGKYKLEMSKYKACRKAKHLKVYNYTSKLLTNAYDNTESEEALLKASTTKYQTKNTLMNLMMSGSSAILFGYYGLGKGTFEWNNIIWCAIQIAIFLTFGCIDYLNAFEYSSKTIREKIKRVISIIDKFKNNIDKYKGKEVK